VNHHVIQRFIRRTFTDGRFEPTFVGAVIKDEAEIVDLTIVFAWLECLRIAHCEFTPFGIVGLLVKDPHHPRQETIAPTSPRRFCVTPTPAICIERIEIRIPLNQCSHLLLREAQRVLDLSG
jgi:hypothetical protein